MTRTTIALLAAVWIVASGCGRQIGDECKDSLDCNNEDNTRTCDLSQPGGYCTIEGCDERSCPEESTCVRFFPAMEFLTKPCDPAVLTSCEANELCLVFATGARCAPRSTEKRNCVLRCEEDGDCRDDYRCQATGGTNALPLTPNPGESPGFCAPR